MDKKQKFIENKNSSKYKYNPNNRSLKRKIISPHVKKDVSEKANRNGHMTEKIAAKNYSHKNRASSKSLATLDYSDPNSVRNHLFKENKIDKSLKEKIFNKDNYSGFLYYPAIILFLSLLIDFILQFVVYGLVDPIWVSIAKNSMFFVTMSLFIMAVNISCYFYLGSTGAKHNYKFLTILKKVSLLAIAFVFVESIFTLLAYFTFLQPYLLSSFSSEAIRQSYLFYLIVWAFLKSILYILVSLSAYFIFYKLKFAKI
jgi:hypothetical protein